MASDDLEALAVIAAVAKGIDLTELFGSGTISLSRRRKNVVGAAAPGTAGLGCSRTGPLRERPRSVASVVSGIMMLYSYAWADVFNDNASNR